MELTSNWSTLLLAGQWCLTGLIYAALLVVVLAVRREMGSRPDHSAAAAVAAPGALRVLQAGSDRRVRAGQVLPLAPETTLGAAPANQLVLADEYVSGQHARLAWDGVQWWIEDLGSSNGTLVDGRPCPPHTRQRVPFGAALTLGDMQFELVQ